MSDFDRDDGALDDYMQSPLGGSFTEEAFEAATQRAYLQMLNCILPPGIELRCDVETGEYRFIKADY